MTSTPEVRYAWNGDVALAYQVVGDALEREPEGARIDEPAFLTRCMALAEQYRLQRRIRHFSFAQDGGNGPHGGRTSNRIRTRRRIRRHFFQTLQQVPE